MTDLAPPYQHSRVGSLLAVRADLSAFQDNCSLSREQLRLDFIREQILFYLFNFSLCLF